MPLLDHFHPPVSDLRTPGGFLSAWVCHLAATLNEQLLPPWHAAPLIRLHSAIDPDGPERTLPDPPDGLTYPPCYEPVAPTATVMLAAAVDLVEVQVFAGSGGWDLVAAVELVSPANKDRPDSCAAIVAKCAALLSDGVGVGLIDIVTRRHANLHDELLSAFDATAPTLDAATYVAGFHPVLRDRETELDVWSYPVLPGERLPSLPLFLRDGPCVELRLEESYRRACACLKLDRDLALLADSPQPRSV